MLSKDSQLNFILTLILAAGMLLGSFFLYTTGIDLNQIPFFGGQPQNASPKYEEKIVIKSSAFENGGVIPEKYTCKGVNVNPLLEIYHVPPNTQSLVLIVDDPEAPLQTFNHWTVFNINSKTTMIPENSLPAGALLGQNSFGKGNYEGPCPIKGTHNYEFKVYALNKVLSEGAGISRVQLLNAMEGHILDRGVLVGIFGK